MVFTGCRPPETEPNREFIEKAPTFIAKFAKDRRRLPEIESKFNDLNDVSRRNTKQYQ